MASNALPHAQRGMALVVVTTLLGAIFVVAAAAARLAMLGERGARNDQDRQVALHAAEAALSDAETDLMGPNTAPSARTCSITGMDTSLFEGDCAGTPAGRGLCSTSSNARPLYQAVDFEDGSAARRYAPYGEFTGRAWASPASAGIPAPPKYIVEAVPHPAMLSPGFRAFQVSALGYGLRPQTQVMLQGLIVKPARSPGC
jgi:type IV pilus assembly protein PilX